jgi:hypothetical protein
MKKIIKRIPQTRKLSVPYAQPSKSQYFSDQTVERRMTELEFLHFSAVAVMRKTIEVIA